jgi:hypothetical protein
MVATSSEDSWKEDREDFIFEARSLPSTYLETT